MLDSRSSRLHVLTGEDAFLKQLQIELNNNGKIMFLYLIRGFDVSVVAKF